MCVYIFNPKGKATRIGTITKDEIPFDLKFHKIESVLQTNGTQHMEHFTSGYRQLFNVQPKPQ